MEHFGWEEWTMNQLSLLDEVTFPPPYCIARFCDLHIDEAIARYPGDPAAQIRWMQEISPSGQWLQRMLQLSPWNRENAEEIVHRFLVSLRAAETWTRGGRSDRESRNDEAGRPRRESPEWYAAYRRTDHWQELRTLAHEYYRGCVLCGTFDGLDVHHRHYQTIGAEQMTDLSVLCNEHHRHSHSVLNIFIPSKCPPAAAVLLHGQNRR
jgi:hypothetical protein